MKGRSIYILLTLTTISASLVILRPNNSQYQNHIADHVYKKVQEDEGILEGVEGDVGLGLLDFNFKDATRTTKNFLQRNLRDEIKEESKSATHLNLYILSLYRFEYNGIIYGSVGAVGKYWTPKETPI